MQNHFHKFNKEIMSQQEFAIISCTTHKVKYMKWSRKPHPLHITYFKPDSPPL